MLSVSSPEHPLLLWVSTTYHQTGTASAHPYSNERECPVTTKYDRDTALLFRSFFVTLSVLGVVGVITGLVLVAGGATWGFVIVGTSGAALVAAAIWLLIVRRRSNNK